MKKQGQVFVSKIAVDLANESDGFVRVAPYGDAPQYDKDGNEVVQRFDYESALRLVKKFKQNANNLLSLLGFKSGAINFYNGHPDFGKVEETRDSRVYAEAEDLEAREDGLYAKIIKKPALELLKKAKGALQISPRWLCALSEDGTVKPFELISFGLVKTGNLAGADFINEKNGEQKMNQKEVEEIGLLLGIEKEKISAEAVLAAIRDLTNRDKGMQDDLKNAKADCEKAKKDAGDEKAKADEAKKDADEKKKALDAANEMIAGLHKEIASSILDKAAAEKKVSPAMREELEKEFAADFVNTRAKVEALPVLKDFEENETQIEKARKAAEDLANAEKVKQESRKAFMDLVNEYKAKNPDYSFADCVAFVSAENKELYEKAQF